MNEPFQLVTNCTFKGKDYLVQMCVLNSKKLELIITDKLMAEDWQCEYDASYIEALTHKTGNYKQFDVFIVMLKSGLLRTTECITLDLLTWDDLEELRNKKIINAYSSSRSSQNSQLNKRYLILTYSVEFDRIHYPLPLEYCGPPNPSILQSNIRRLEAELERLKQKNLTQSKCDENENKQLKEKIKILSEDNEFLSEEVRRLNKLLSKKENPVKSMQALQSSLKKLEDRVLHERNHNHQSILKLKAENTKLTNQVEELKKREKCLRMQLRAQPLRHCRRSYLSPDRSAERRNRLPESSTYQTAPRCNSPPLLRSTKPKNVKRIQNRFLSSSSSESEAVVKTSGRRPGEATRSSHTLCVKGNRKFRSTSKESSRHSSEDSKGKPQSHRSSRSLVKRGNHQEGKTDNKTGVRSRESSVSSRCSSKQSKVSRVSNRGSGDHPPKSRTQTFKSLETKEDLKFSVSDLETRIHALQRLLSEGLKF